ncbi:electron transport complex subunit RsxC [Duncaniella muricolitica]|jgi:electron transport complex protein RnfC|uniref:electron transport complex subunit RsxC n=1 Tax=Duncaniella muricolitica TaxID=2880704 RepID=UPI00244E05E0|nr:electron transport complex subunit RsxC [Duncaniella muricolitica]
MKLHTFKIGGVHPAENKIAAGKPIVNMPLPAEVVLPVAQHIGAPAKPIVAKGDHVKRGDRVAEAGGFVSAHVHTPISGTVVKIDTARTPQGMPVEAIYIKSDEADREADAAAMADTKPKRSDAEIAALDSKAIIELIKDAGIVGLGGATFPAHVKLMPPPGSKAEVVIINAAECEPCLSCDDMLMRENAREIVKGVQLLVRAAGVNRAVIAIENNKPEAIVAMTEACASAPGIEVMTMQVKYPQGGEKQLIAAVTGREVPSGALPIATGCIVQNVATAYAVYRAVYHNEPILDRVLTLHDGNEGKNLRVPLGTMLSTLVEPGMEYEKIILGGPMMGRTASTLNTPMIKGTSGILLDPRYAHRREPEPCIRCAACVNVCPMGLEPFLLSTLSRLKQYDEAEQEKIANCIECGSCSYICPSSRPILDFIRVGKGKVMAAMRARAAAAK